MSTSWPLKTPTMANLLFKIGGVEMNFLSLQNDYCVSFTRTLPGSYESKAA